MVKLWRATEKALIRERENSAVSLSLTNDHSFRGVDVRDIAQLEQHSRLRFSFRERVLNSLLKRLPGHRTRAQFFPHNDSVGGVCPVEHQRGMSGEDDLKPFSRELRQSMANSSDTLRVQIKLRFVNQQKFSGAVRFRVGCCFCEITDQSHLNCSLRTAAELPSRCTSPQVAALDSAHHQSRARERSPFHW